MALVSVIIPTRDRPNLLERALRSVLEQTCGDLEVIVVDNNRTSSPVADQANLAPLLRDTRVRIVSARQAANASEARNVGLSDAGAEWVTFLDDDDEYVPSKVADQLAVARCNEAPLVICGYEVMLGVRRRRIQVGREAFQGDELLLDAIWGTPFLFALRSHCPQFPPGLDAAEDLHFAFALLSRHGVRRVPCVGNALVRVHLQPGEARVNVRHEAHWRATRQLLLAYGQMFSPTAKRRFLLRAMLQREKGTGAWRRLWAISARLIRDGGTPELRRALNASAYRTGVLRRWIVS